MLTDKPRTNNRYRQYTMTFPADVAERIKKAARARGITEQKWIEGAVAQQLFATPAGDMVSENA